MQPHSSLNKPPPKRTLSSAGLDVLDELLHDPDSGPCKRRQSLSNTVNPYDASAFTTPLPPDQHDFAPPSASYYRALRRPELLSFSEKTNSSRGFEEDGHSLSEDNNFPDEQYHDLDHDFQAADARVRSRHAYKSSNPFFSSPAFTSHDPQDSLFEHRLSHDHEAVAEKPFDHYRFFPPSHRSVGRESSPREEFLIQAFGPSGLKLHTTSVASNEDLEERSSDDSSDNNREAESMTDADTELKLSFHELEADLRSAMHQPSSPQQHATRLPELPDLSHSSFSMPLQGSPGLNRLASPSNNQDPSYGAIFAHECAHGLSSQHEDKYFSRDSLLATTGQPKGNASGLHVPTKWLRDEDERLRVAVGRFGGKNWKMIAETLGNGRTDVQCLHRWNKVLKPGLIKGPWTPEEDRILTSLITRYGVGKIRWCDLALHLPGRIGKQCRERWCNHLDSRIRKGQWTVEEDDMVFRWQQKLGNKWSEIAKLLPGRTENAVKNRFNSAARRKWLMNQASKSASTATSRSTSTRPSHAPLLQPPHGYATRQDDNGYNGSAGAYGGGTLSSEVLVEHQSHNRIPPLGRQPSLLHFAPPGTLSTNVGLPAACDKSRPLFRPVEGIGQGYLHQEHDKSADIGEIDSLLLASPSTLVPPPLNALFSPLPAIVASGSSPAVHPLTISPTHEEASMTPVFPLPAQFPLSAPIVKHPAKSPSVKHEQAESSVLQLHDETIERDNLDLEATPAAAAGHDSNVPMDDENMNSFLDSVALELEDIVE